MSAEVPVVKDGESERPVPSVWRPAFQEIVRAFVRGDYGVVAGVDGVAEISASTTTQIRDYIRSYGETLIELPEQAWESSVCMWMGTHWDVLVDLWTESEGRSDLVLHARVTESAPGHVLDVYMVYVP